ncbi:ABC transporter ATP-binding protein [Ktedonospora formicarum]|uniref:Daunorubicin resistance protein DrrA family ABC transporter ATP-binding protein n=1 Tax=Ktedonospora formicarum TaxID=2778364 RepID=A0A8J3MTM5_9CHLR|nr:ABC transporter ATP-binding protein [Ktedonospora formicarum]GHO47290.1 daunorubicin resistance protein DrrA family ABC transporter ATP-binding protein [Ktedonospora formicarum]
MQPNETTPAIVIEALSKEYRLQSGQAKTAVNRLNLAIPRGQICGFLGTNGAGKTTTIKMLCGLILPSQGRALVNGYDVSHEHRQTMRHIGVVLEGARNIYWRLSAFENLLYFGHLKGCHGATLRKRAGQLLHELDLWDRRDQAVRTFSRGMQQKVAIACALIADPPIVLLDEPTLGLDVQAAQTVKAWIARLCREQGKTIVLTTHQLEIVEALCERVAIMQQGHLIADEPLDRLLEQFQKRSYQITLQGPLTPEQVSAFAPLRVSSAGSMSVISRDQADQASLYHTLTLIEHMGLSLRAVQYGEPSLEEVFLGLMQQAERQKIHG